MNVGATIRRIREARHMTQAELAARVRVTQAMICQIERGSKACTIPLGVEIAAALECSLEDLTA